MHIGQNCFILTGGHHFPFSILAPIIPICFALFLSFFEYAKMISFNLEYQPTSTTENFENVHFPFSLSELSMAKETIQPMNAFFELFFATEKSVECGEWEKALPTKLERQQMRKLIHFLFRIDNFSTISSDHSLLQRFVPTLAKYVQLSFISVGHNTLRTFSASSTNASHQMTSSKGFPASGGTLSLRHVPILYGLTFITPPRTSNRMAMFATNQQHCLRGLYPVHWLSAVLVVSRNVTSPCQSHFAEADAAHNDQTMFHTMCTALLEADRGKGTFIQWHGMAPTSCDGASAFLSAGVSRGHPIYTKAGAALNKLVHAVNSLKGERTATTPDTDPKCRLVASTNLFGRIINGVPFMKACNTNAQAKDVQGKFIHIEQKEEMINDWETWTEALGKTFQKERRPSDQNANAFKT